MIFDKIYRSQDYIGLKEKISNNHVNCLLTGVSDGLFDSLVMSIYNDYGNSNICIIVKDDQESDKLYSELLSCGIESIRLNEKKYNFKDLKSSHEYEFDRIKTIYKLKDSDKNIVIISLKSALQCSCVKKFYEYSYVISDKSKIDVDGLIEKLCSIGYTHTDIVESMGQFSVRGGIIDIFSPYHDYPVRIELYGDEIDSMSSFEIASQRRNERVENYYIIPSRECLIDDEIRNSINKYLSRLKEDELSDFEIDIRNKVQNDIRNKSYLLSYSDLFSPIISDGGYTLDLFDGYLLLLKDYSLILNCFDEIERSVDQLFGSEDFSHIISKNKFKYYLDKKSFKSRIEGSNKIIVDNFGKANQISREMDVFDFQSKHLTGYNNKGKLLIDDINYYINSRFYIDVIVDNMTIAKNVQSILKDNGLDANISSASEYVSDSLINIVYGINIPGFEFVKEKYVCINDIISGIGISQNGKKRKQSRYSENFEKGKKILSFSELTSGDYVVHINHGIGIYDGITTIMAGGSYRDFIKIKYSGSDVIYTPCENINLISKYIGSGSENETVKLSKIGSSEWTKKKKTAKKSAEDIAKRLIDIYSERLNTEGFAFPEDDEIQNEFEDSFEYTDTYGQEISSDEIKKDMEKPYPMDRLLCGDVGFGKTEIAMRAAFKAVYNNKQVAVLVPTSILAMQHYKSFSARMINYPINIDIIIGGLSSSDKKKKLMRLKRGETDLIIGTHRLLSNDVEFKDLGLLIVDEEQKFGVIQKEKLKERSKNIDVLTLSATPIPRTINMALSGIKDISILETGPENRHPVQTYILEYDENTVYDAIDRELSRNGQVYYLVNNIDKMYLSAEKLKSRFPDASIVVANGKMDKYYLSDIWDEMSEGKIDILVCTTIIEAGVDIPNVNTLIVENSDRFGLSQLHQIRGRIGRSHRFAYAYLTYPKYKSISEDSVKRLKAIEEYTEFGSGFRIALRDMEIRGAGNLLGSEQHGFLNSVGYDLYMSILNDAIKEQKGEIVYHKQNTLIEYFGSLYIPDSYISNESQKIEAYKKISLIDSYESYLDVIDELIDRYGEIPQDVINLSKISLIRHLATDKVIKKIEIKENLVIFVGISNINDFISQMDTKLFSLISGYMRNDRIGLRYKNADCLDSIIKLLESK